MRPCNCNTRNAPELYRPMPLLYTGWFLQVISKHRARTTLVAMEGRSGRGVSAKARSPPRRARAELKRDSVLVITNTYGKANY